jgi:ABC-type Fe3+ transport system permease subunit
VVLAGMFTALLTWNEIGITDFVKVRTFGEEVYTQFVGGGEAEVARAVAVALPALILTGLGAWIVVTRWRTGLPPRASLVRPARLFALGWRRWPCFLVVALTALLLLGVPVGGLVWKAGLRYGTAVSPGPPTWEAILLVERLAAALRGQGWLLGISILLGLSAGLLTSLAALWCAWLARGSRWFEASIWLLAALLWAIPGPLLGVGLLDLIGRLMELPGGSVFKLLLYERPSPLPNLWICCLRFFPLALAALWPLVRLIPPELEEAAVMDGLAPFARFRRVVLPVMRGPLLWTALGVAVLTLGELSASKLVTTPGFTPLAHHVFQQMHASADTELAALCLVLLLAVAVGAAGVAWGRRFVVNSR